jgi:nucleoid-associated protein YgaU
MAFGILDKLKIIPFLDAEALQSALPSGPPFIAQFNPETLTIKNEVKLNTEQTAQGANGAEAKQVKVEPQEFNFDFPLDGTGAAGPSLDVFAAIELFKLTTGFTGETHRNRFLVLQWGTFVTTCVLKSYSINYKLFRADGTPLRAVISATFLEHKSLELQDLISNLMSPDVTYLHEVKETEHLSQLSHEKYKNGAYYYQIAHFNKLDSLRKLRSGQTLVLPPLAKGDER